MPSTDLHAWHDQLRERHLQRLSFSEVRRAVRALSDVYVHKRDKVLTAALNGAGKRAAFGMYYTPLHFLAVDHIVRQLGLHRHSLPEVLDLGCGTGAGGLAWGAAAGCKVRGFDRDPWVIKEAQFNATCLGVAASFQRRDVDRLKLPGPEAGIVLAYVVNELPEGVRRTLLTGLLQRPRVLVVEPIGKRQIPWWGEWTAAFAEAGGRHDEWRWQADLPPDLALMDKAAGLNHRTMKARSLCLGATV